MIDNKDRALKPEIYASLALMAPGHKAPLVAGAAVLAQVGGVVLHGLQEGDEVVTSGAIPSSGCSDPMIRRLVTIALNSPSAVVIAVLALIFAGLISYERLDIEAYPNPVPPLVELITQPEGWSAEEVERQITIPLEVALAGMPGLEHIRSQSLFGLSDVKCYFGWETDYKDARQEVINRLQFVTLPNGLQAQISPWNAIGEVFRYIVRGKGYTIRDLKTAQDWILEREFRRVPGVIDVTSYRR